MIAAAFVPTGAEALKNASIRSIAPVAGESVIISPTPVVLRVADFSPDFIL
jgi:hypothetical protein